MLRQLDRWRTVVAVLGGLMLGGCAGQTEPVDVYVIGLTPESSTLLEQRVRVELRVQNPNDRAYAVRGARIALDLNGRRFARGVSDQAFSVPPLGEATFALITTTSLVDVVRQVMALPGATAVDYTLNGRLFLQQGYPRSVGFKRAGELQLRGRTLRDLGEPPPLRRPSGVVPADGT